jgi:hypothetical protein
MFSMALLPVASHPIFHPTRHPFEHSFQDELRAYFQRQRLSHQFSQPELAQALHPSPQTMLAQVDLDVPRPATCPEEESLRHPT